MSEDKSRGHRVVVAGGGVAELEAVCALHALAPGETHVTLLEPQTEFTLKALSVEHPFAAAGSRAYHLDAICDDHATARVRAELAPWPGHRRPRAFCSRRRTPWTSR